MKNSSSLGKTDSKMRTDIDTLISQGRTVGSMRKIVSSLRKIVSSLERTDGSLERTEYINQS